MNRMTTEAVNSSANLFGLRDEQWMPSMWHKIDYGAKIQVRIPVQDVPRAIS